ncbi:MAG: hypothetical protein ACN6O7_09610 [Sphingobacterium sp.]
MAFAQTKTTAVDHDSSAYIETQDGMKLSAKHLSYKMLSDDKKTVDKLDHIDASPDRTYDFGKHGWDYKIKSYLRAVVDSLVSFPMARKRTILYQRPST